mmetsp:Transcript_27947/g.73312  ORF Transcript_27947/g.73312 Transcript_27947/m.73312 type:complete len:226 (-) Transcript_27947:366-1043(-)
MWQRRSLLLPQPPKGLLRPVLPWQRPNRRRLLCPNLLRPLRPNWLRRLRPNRRQLPFQERRLRRQSRHRLPAQSQHLRRQKRRRLRTQSLRLVPRLVPLSTPLARKRKMRLVMEMVVLRRRRSTRLARGSGTQRRGLRCSASSASRRLESGLTRRSKSLSQRSRNVAKKTPTASGPSNSASSLATQRTRWKRLPAHSSRQSSAKSWRTLRRCSCSVTTTMWSCPS